MNLWRVVLIVLLLLTWAMRLQSLTAVPPGLSHDEAGNGHDSAAILRGIHRLYFPTGYGREPLYTYSVAVVTALLGQSIFALRLTTVLWSLATWILTVALARQWWGNGAALCTAGSLTVGFWPLMMARVGLRAPTLPATLAASALVYTHATRAKRAWSSYTLAGLCLGLSFYTYMASRGMPLLYLGLLVILAGLDRVTLRRVWAGTLVVVLVAGLVGAPLFCYLRARPELEQRITQLGGALVAARHGDLTPLWTNLTGTLPMLLWQADHHWIYNIGGRPALEPFLAFGFLVGIGTLLSKATRDWRTIFVLLWWAGGLAPALITAPDYSTLHAIAALPPTFLLIGRGLATISRRAYPWGAGMLIGGFLITGYTAAHAYFVTWGQSSHVRTLYHHQVVTLGRHLETLREPLPVVITTLTPGEFHDPYVIEVTLRRTDLDIRYADGTSALFYPRNMSRLYVESQAQPPSELQTHAAAVPDSAPLLAYTIGETASTMQGYHWNAQNSWESLTVEMSRAILTAPGDPVPNVPHQHAITPVIYGEVVALRGYHLLPESPRPGDTLIVLTVWTVASSYSKEVVLFTHMLSSTGDLVAQVDRLDAPNWQWQPGDRFVQLHRLSLPSDLPPGDYALAIGYYRRADGVRLAIADASPSITRVLIPFSVP